MTRIICISDTHKFHRKINIPNGDILIHAGDIGCEVDSKILLDFNQWLGSLPHKYKIVIPGNHDFYIENNQNLSKILLSNAILLIDNLIKIDGYKIYGSPWQPEFFNWAWNLPRGFPLKKVWSRIPNDIDILITHGPPSGILDFVPLSNENAGCIDLLSRVKEISPKLHIFGHIHEGYGKLLIDNIHFINACICTRNYKPINKPIVIDIL